MTDPIQGCCQLRTATSRLIEFVSPMAWGEWREQLSGREGLLGTGISVVSKGGVGLDKLWTL